MGFRNFITKSFVQGIFEELGKKELYNQFMEQYDPCFTKYCLLPQEAKKIIIEYIEGSD